MSRPANSRILLVEPRPQPAGSVEDPGRLAPAGRYSHLENLYGALGPNGVFFQGSIELLGGLAIFKAAMATEAVLHGAGRLISAVIPANVNGSVDPGQW